MSVKIKYLAKHFYYQMSYFKTHNLTPLFMYIISILFLTLGLATLSEPEMMRYLYIVIGLNTTIWLFSMVVLNRNTAFYKDSIVKVNYVPLVYRILPAILFQTFVFLIMLVLSIAVASLFIGVWVIGIFSLLYYVLLGVLLIIPFTMLYLILGRPDDKINIAVFIILVISVPVLYLPENLPDIMTHILSLNPFYYVVNGLQANAISITWEINRLPHDVLFFTEIGIVYLWIFKFYSKMKFSIYNFNKNRQDV